MAEDDDWRARIDRTAAVQLLDKWTRERTLTSTEAGDLRRALVALLGGL